MEDLSFEEEEEENLQMDSTEKDED